MIAIFRVLLPFDIYLPRDIDMKPISLKDEAGELLVNILPPYASKLKHADISFKMNKPAFNLFDGLVEDLESPVASNVMINGLHTVMANCLQIDFHKESFNRTIPREAITLPQTDPPIERIFSILNGVIEAFRAIGKVGFLRPIRYDSTYWVLSYRNDDLAELPEQEGLLRSHMVASMLWQVFALSNEVWAEVSSNLLTIDLPTWERLFMDALSLFPENGPSIVLCYSAIETLCSITLDYLSRGKLPEDLWHWITERRPYFHRPNTEQLLDAILKSLSGSSLKDDASLWEGFQQLNKARNNYAHRGKLEIDGIPVSNEKAAELLRKAGAILEWLEAKLPEGMQRYKPKFQINLQMLKMLQAPRD